MINLRSQIATLKRGEHSKYLPTAFTEQGVAMLSLVLKSKQAIQVNIQIMRTFIEIKKTLASYEGLRKKVEAMEKKHDGQFKAVFEVLKKIMDEDDEKKSNRLGFT